MKITQVKPIPLQIPLKRAFATSRATQTAARVVLIKLRTDSGMVGLGECDPRPHITGETMDSALTAIRNHLAPSLMGLELSEISDLAKLCRRMDEVLVSNPAAKAGIDIAAHDALGKAKGIPVYALLGQKVRESVDTIGFGDLGTIAQAKEDAQMWLKRGCTAFKIKAGSEWELDSKRVEAARSVLGPAVELVVDPNQAWSVETSIEILRESENRFAACEQPIPWNDFLGLTEISAAVKVPIMADEAVWSPDHARTLLRLKGADMVNIKHVKSGGLHRANEIARILNNAGVPTMLGSTTETGISSMASVHLALACPGLRFFDVAPPTDFLLEDIVEGLAWNGCRVRPSNLPGLGVELQENRVEQYGM